MLPLLPLSMHNINSIKKYVIYVIYMRNTLYNIHLFLGSRYEKVCTTNGAFSLAQKFVAMSQYFWYRSSPRKILSTQANERSKIHRIRSHCIQAISTRPLQSDVVFSHLQLVPIRTIQFLVGNFLTYPGNKYNNNFFYYYWKYCPRSSHQPRKLGRYLDLLWKCFQAQIQKTVIIALVVVLVRWVVLKPCSRMEVPCSRMEVRPYPCWGSFNTIFAHGSAMFTHGSASLPPAGVVLVPCSPMEVRPCSYFRWCKYF